MAQPMASGARLKLRVKNQDGSSFDIQTIPFDTLQYERKYGKKFSDGQGSVEMIFWLAYRAGGRMKLITESTFDKWMQDVVEDIEFLDDDEPSTDTEDQPAGEDPTSVDSPMEESLS